MYIYIYIYTHTLYIYIYIVINSNRNHKVITITIIFQHDSSENKSVIQISRAFTIFATMCIIDGSLTQILESELFGPLISSNNLHAHEGR